MGAGVLPFCVLDGKVFFLFQKVFKGRKSGYLIDFGGGLSTGEDYVQTAMREFIEETETMFFSSDIETASRTTESVEEQLPIIRELFDKTLHEHPEWWCQRESDLTKTPKDWRTYFIEFEYRDVDLINKEWKNDSHGRFRKRRKLFWITLDELLDIYQQSPEKLWKRVRQLSGIEQTIQSIRLDKETSSS